MAYRLPKSLVGEYNAILMQYDMPREWYEKLEIYYRMKMAPDKKLDKAFKKILGGKDEG